MTTCENCRAPLSDDLEKCSHCGSITARGIALRAERQRQEEQARAAERERANATADAQRRAAMAEVDKLGKWSLIAALVGTILCCVFPVGPALGVYFSRRAGALAKQHGLTSAGLGPLGFIVSLVGLGLAVFVWIGAGVMSFNESQRKAALRAEIGSAETLDLKTACALTELELLETHYEDYISTEDFECAGVAELAVDGKRALLRGGRFTKDQQRIEVFACLEQRSGWVVEHLRHDADCDGARPEPKQKNRRKK